MERRRRSRMRWRSSVTGPRCARVTRRSSSSCAGHAGFECVIVSGYGRGLGFDPIEDAAPPLQVEPRVERGAHRRHLVPRRLHVGTPATWILLPRAFSATTARAISSPIPGDSSTTHCPAQEEWQLLKTPLSWAEFCALPDLRGAFFQAGLSEGPRAARREQGDRQVQLLTGCSRGHRCRRIPRAFWNDRGQRGAEDLLPSGRHPHALRCDIPRAGGVAPGRVPLPPGKGDGQPRLQPAGRSQRHRERRQPPRLPVRRAGRGPRGGSRSKERSPTTRVSTTRSSCHSPCLRG